MTSTGLGLTLWPTGCLLPASLYSHRCWWLELHQTKAGAHLAIFSGCIRHVCSRVIDDSHHPIRVCSLSLTASIIIMRKMDGNSFVALRPLWPTIKPANSCSLNWEENRHGVCRCRIFLLCSSVSSCFLCSFSSWHHTNKRAEPMCRWSLFPLDSLPRKDISSFFFQKFNFSKFLFFFWGKSGENPVWKHTLAPIRPPATLWPAVTEEADNMKKWTRISEPTATARTAPCIYWI